MSRKNRIIKRRLIAGLVFAAAVAPPAAQAGPDFYVRRPPPRPQRLLSRAHRPFGRCRPARRPDLRPVTRPAHRPDLRRFQWSDAGIGAGGAAWLGAGGAAWATAQRRRKQAAVSG